MTHLIFFQRLAPSYPSAIPLVVSICLHMSLVLGFGKLDQTLYPAQNYLPRLEIVTHFSNDLVSGSSSATITQPNPQAVSSSQGIGVLKKPPKNPSIAHSATEGDESFTASPSTEKDKWPTTTEIPHDPHLPVTSSQLPAVLYTPPPAFNISYKVTGTYKFIPYQSQSLLQWKPQNSNYELHYAMQIPFVGTRSQTSLGTLSPNGGLLPTKFTESGKTEYAAHFQNDKKQVSFSSTNQTIPFMEVNQDRLSFLIQLSGWIANHRTSLEHSEVAFDWLVVSSRSAVPWHLQFNTRETLDLPLGNNLATFKFTRSVDSKYSGGKVEVWFLDDTQPLPVRIRLTLDNGEIIDKMAQRIDLK
ncbi:MAG: DUF3108 domain-containing protein [Gammaproteobacteria bacterium]|nr:DUF3108 domain-containing protein [Gammaproteobacteria bacterium]